MSDFYFAPEASGVRNEGPIYGEEEIGQQPREFVIEVEIPQNQSQTSEFGTNVNPVIPEMLMNLVSNLLSESDPNQLDQLSAQAGDNPIIFVDPQGRTILMTQEEMMNEAEEEGRIPVAHVHHRHDLPHLQQQQPIATEGIPSYGTFPHQQIHRREEPEVKAMNLEELERALEEIQAMARERIREPDEEEERKDEIQRQEPQQPKGFFQRLGDYSLVNRAYSGYDYLKNSNFFLRAGLSTAEKVFSYTSPGIFLSFF